MPPSRCCCHRIDGQPARGEELLVEPELVVRSRPVGSTTGAAARRSAVDA
jgi:hypothetical protein